MKSYTCFAFAVVTLCLSTIISSFAQCGNLVINGGFETANTPHLDGIFSNVLSPSAGTIDELANWSATNLSSPDYYNTTGPVDATGHTNPLSTNPFTGYFLPFNYSSSSVNGCLGLITTYNDYRNNYGTHGIGNYGEFATQKLAFALKGGKKYYATMQVRNAPKFGYTSRIGLDITVSDPHNFTTTSYYGYYGPFQEPHFYTHTGCGIQSNGVILANDWQPVRGTFTGVQDAQWINIGNFGTPADNPSVSANHPNATEPTPYILIDEVGVYEIPTAGQPAFCSGGSVTIGEGCHIPGATYEWRRSGSPNSVLGTSINISVNITDTYTLKVTLPDNSTFSSSVAVTGCNPQPTVIGSDFVCAGNSTTFYTNPAQNVVWSTSPSGAFNPSSGYGPSFATTPIAGGTITATFINLTGYPSISKSVSLSSVAGMGSTLDLITDFGPMPDPQTGVPNNYDDYCYSQKFTFTVPSNYTAGATGYQWTVSGYNVYSSSEVSSYSENGSTMSFTPLTTYPGPYRNVNVTCTISYGPNCPAGESYRSLTIASQDENGNQCVMYRAAPPQAQQPEAAYPNPATELLIMPKAATNATLLNSQGKEVKSSDKKGNVDVRDLPAGLYNLRMKQNGKFINQRIEVKH